MKENRTDSTNNRTGQSFFRFIKRLIEIKRDKTKTKAEELWERETKQNKLKMIF